MNNMKQDNEFTRQRLIGTIGAAIEFYLSNVVDEINIDVEFEEDTQGGYTTIIKTEVIVEKDDDCIKSCTCNRYPHYMDIDRNSVASRLATLTLNHITKQLVKYYKNH